MCQNLVLAVVSLALAVVYDLGHEALDVILLEGGERARVPLLFRFRANMAYLERFQGLSLASQGQNLASNALYYRICAMVVYELSYMCHMSCVDLGHEALDVLLLGGGECARVPLAFRFQANMEYLRRF